MTETGHSRTVFYRHFDDIPDLVLAVLQDVGTELYEISKRWAASIERGRSSVRASLGEVVDFWSREGPLLRAVAEAAHHDEEIEAIYSGFLRLYEELTEKALARELEAGRIHGLDAHETARALTCLNEGYLLDAFGRAPATGRDEALGALTIIWERVLYGNGTGGADDAGDG
jgi:AcrR family transcriptional regulator